MGLAKFEIDCENPEIVMKAVEKDDNEKIQYIFGKNKLIFIVESEDIESLMKISYSTCSRIQLAMDTIKKFGK